jgi:hypothetical protein
MDISPANELDNVNNIQSTTLENTNNIQSSEKSLQGNTDILNQTNQTNQSKSTIGEDVKASNEFGGYTEIHSSELNKKADDDKSEINRINIIFGIFIIVLLFILIPIYTIVRYSLYDDIIPYIKTNIFFFIRQWWIFVVIVGCIYLPILIIKYLKKLFFQIKDTIAYIYNPLKDSTTAKRYNFFKYIKVKLFYIIFARTWFIIMLIFMLLWFMIVLAIMLLLCYMIGHMIGWMDYFWILR